jgi:hypothetical protein
VWRLFQPGPAEPAAPRTARAGDPGAALARAIVCAACRRRITTPEARIEIAGRHDHECVNPHGWRWRIGCFAVAEGLVVVSDPDPTWSWFPGYTWQIQHCAGCGRLLGWLYRAGESSFHGLILAHLMDDPGPS